MYWSSRMYIVERYVQLCTDACDAESSELSRFQRLPSEEAGAQNDTAHTQVRAERLGEQLGAMVNRGGTW